jgi:hypothetical protein
MIAEIFIVGCHSEILAPHLKRTTNSRIPYPMIRQASLVCKRFRQLIANLSDHKWYYQVLDYHHSGTPCEVTPMDAASRLASFLSRLSGFSSKAASDLHIKFSVQRSPHRLLSIDFSILVRALWGLVHPNMARRVVSLEVNHQGLNSRDTSFLINTISDIAPLCHRMRVVTLALSRDDSAIAPRGYLCDYPVISPQTACNPLCQSLFRFLFDPRDAFLTWKMEFVQELELHRECAWETFVDLILSCSTLRSLKAQVAYRKDITHKKLSAMPQISSSLERLGLHLTHGPLGLEALLSMFQFPNLCYARFKFQCAKGVWKTQLKQIEGRLQDWFLNRTLKELEITLEVRLLLSVGAPMDSISRI